MWTFSFSGLAHFADGCYYPHSFQFNDDESARLAKIKSKITAKEAKAIARDSLHKLGFTEKQLKLIGSPSVHQYRFEESDGRIYPLPTFHVGWKLKEFLK